MYRALTTFCGVISMREGEIRAIENKTVAADLLRAGYVTKINDPEKTAKEPKKKRGTKK